MRHSLPFVVRGRKLATMKKEDAREGYERASVNVGAELIPQAA
jgi:hypothetical protein